MNNNNNLTSTTPHILLFNAGIEAAKWAPDKFLVLVDLENSVLNVELSSPPTQLNLKHLVVQLFRVTFLRTDPTKTYDGTLDGHRGHETFYSSDTINPPATTTATATRRDVLYKSIIVDTTQVKRNNDTEIDVQFKDIPPGTYHIIMYPKPYNAKDECLCLIDYKQCSCLMNEIPDFIIPDIPNDAATWGQYQILDTFYVPTSFNNSSKQLSQQDLTPSTGLLPLTGTIFVQKYQIVCKFIITEHGGWKHFDTLTLKLFRQPLQLPTSLRAAVTTNFSTSAVFGVKDLSKPVKTEGNSSHFPPPAPKNPHILYRNDILYKSYHHFFNTSSLARYIRPPSGMNGEFSSINKFPLDNRAKLHQEIVINNIKVGREIVEVFNNVPHGKYFVEISPKEPKGYCLCHLSHSKKCVVCQSVTAPVIDLPKSFNVKEFKDMYRQDNSFLSNHLHLHDKSKSSSPVRIDSYNSSHINEKASSSPYQLNSFNTLIPILSVALITFLFLTLILTCLCKGRYKHRRSKQNHFYNRKKYRCLEKFFIVFEGHWYTKNENNNNNNVSTVAYPSKTKFPMNFNGNHFTFWRAAKSQKIAPPYFGNRYTDPKHPKNVTVYDKIHNNNNDDDENNNREIIRISNIPLINESSSTNMMSKKTGKSSDIAKTYFPIMQNNIEEDSYFELLPGGIINTITTHDSDHYEIHNQIFDKTAAHLNNYINSDDNFIKSSGSSLLDPIDRSRRILVVYFPDNLHHSRTLKNFVSFLGSEHKLSVTVLCNSTEDDEYALIAQGKWEWIQRQLLECTRIILINSPALYDIYTSRISSPKSAQQYNQLVQQSLREPPPIIRGLVEESVDFNAANELLDDSSSLERSLCKDLINTLFDMYYANWQPQAFYENSKETLSSSSSDRGNNICYSSNKPYAVNDVASKLLSCKFSTTPQEVCIPFLTSGYLYNLPDNINELLQVLKNK